MATPTGHPTRSTGTRTGCSGRSRSSGEAWVSVTTLRGRTFLRAGVVNYLSTETDVDRMLEALRRLSVEVVRELDLG